MDADVLSAIVTLSERYITDRYLPDKAIDCLLYTSLCAMADNGTLAVVTDDPGSAAR